MKTKLFIVALLASLGAATPARAQSGVVGWYGSVGSCSVDITRTTAFPITGGFTGTITFAPISSGHIFLRCLVGTITSGVDPSSINAWGLWFENQNGVAGCSVTATFIASNFPTVVGIIGSFTTGTNSYDWKYVDLSTPLAGLDFNRQRYEVDIDLYRKPGANCAPAFWVSFVEVIIP
jgi:hypothetical protein